MMYSMQILALFALLVGFVRSHPWDIVEGGDKQLLFYFNGTLTHREHIPSATKITSVTYDPVHRRVFYVDYKNTNMSISSFDLSTGNVQTLITKETGLNTKVVYDPITQVLLWKDGPYSIYSLSINLTSSNNAVGGNLLVSLQQVCRDIAVDVCGGYIYWITDSKIERARLDGTEREDILIDNSTFMRISLVLDQQTQKMYWLEKETSAKYNVYLLSIQSANFNGKDRATLYKFSNEIFANSLAVSNNFIYWKNDLKEVWQLPKNPPKDAERKLYSMPSPNCESCEFISANYTLEEQIQGIKSCEAAQRTVQNTENLAYICHNYCLQGNCSVNAEGQPKCSCKAGYSGERCEVDVCHKHCLNDGVCTLNEEDKPVCECTAAYEGARCDISLSKKSSFQATCSLSAEGQPNITVTLRKAKSRSNSIAVEKIDLVNCKGKF